MSTPFLRHYVGWHPWRFIKTYYNGDIVPFGKIPTSSLPSSKIWGQSIAIHCKYMPPWTSFDDPFVNLLATTGLGGFTLASLTSGMAVAAIQMQYPTQVTLAIGPAYEPPPTLGYCVGDLYKENVYFYLSIAKINTFFPLLVTFTNDVFQRSRIRRIYLQHGDVTNFKESKDSNNKDIGLLSLDYNNIVPKSILDKVRSGQISFDNNDTIKITKRGSNTSFDLNIKGLRDNWVIETSLPPNQQTPQGTQEIAILPGDFYEFKKPWCIEDPLQVSGFWLGNENEQITARPNSGYGVHLTDYNHPYDLFAFTGAYIWKTNVNGVATTTLTSTTSDLDNMIGGEWYFVPFDNPPSDKDKSQYYSSNTRYRDQSVVVATNSGSNISDTTTEVINGNQVEIIRQTTFKTGTTQDITDWKQKWGTLNDVNAVSFIRMELNQGGGAYYQNWHAPNMAKCWLIQNGKYFKIYSQPDGNVIDIALKDITNQNNLDTTAFAHSNIFNQYTWMINEHQMGENFNGIFGGQISSITYNSATNESTLIVNVDSSGRGTFESTSRNYNPTYLNSVNNFYNRYRLDPSQIITTNTMKPMYDKRENWKLVKKQFDSPTYNIKGIAFSAMPTDRFQQYTETIVVEGGKDISVNEKVYIAFNTPYEISGGWGVGGQFFYDVQQGATDELTPTVCFDMDWLSAPIVTFVPKGTIVGVCGGRYWGLGSKSQEFIYSENGADLLFTTPTGMNCTSSLYNKYAEEDWVLYKDVYTDITSLRRGTLDFRDYPKKSEISIGPTSLTEDITGPSFELNQNQQRLKRISFKVPNADRNTNGQNIMVTVKSKDRYYGSLVTGKGDVDLQSLRKQGIAEGSIPSSTYMFDDYPSSPSYVYRRNKGDSYLDNNSIDVGVSTKESPIYLVSGTTILDVSNVTAEYTTNKQMLINSKMFDTYKVEDGEEIIVYGYPVSSFMVNNRNCNNLNDGNEWITQAGVFIIGNGNEAREWGSPLVKFLEHNIPLWQLAQGENPNNYTLPAQTDFKYPLMVLPDCEYLGSTYHYNFQQLYVFARCYISKNLSFIGCFSTSFNSLLYKAYKATNIRNMSYLDFLYRPLSLPVTLLDNGTTSPLVSKSQINLPRETVATNYDRFSKVLDNGDSINVINPFVMEDGTLAVLYDVDEGVKLLYSRNGMSFNKCPIIIARNAYSPLHACEEFIAFITNEGIGIKIAIDINLYEAMKLGDMSSSEGNYNSLFEEIQRGLDNKETILIGSGPIPTQKLSGYKTVNGIYKIFFYSSDNTLACMDSNNLRNWKFASNF